MLPMKLKRIFIFSRPPPFSFSRLQSLAGPSADITDVASPVRVDGDLSDWTAPPVISLMEKENVVVGQGDWTGPEYANAKISIVYDKTNLYIAADITSKTPQYNGMNAGDIYNGDALEMYMGTGLNQSSTKVLFFTRCSSGDFTGENGENAEVYSVTDLKAIFQRESRCQTYLQGLYVGSLHSFDLFLQNRCWPWKSIGFDIALDDVGANSKPEPFNLLGAKAIKAGRIHPVGELFLFKDAAVYVNTAPKQGMPGAQSVELDPAAGKKNASTLGTLIWGFNGDVGGFEGKVTQDAVTVSEGTGALRVDADGSQGWNQNLAFVPPFHWLTSGKISKPLPWMCISRKVV